MLLQWVSCDKSSLSWVVAFMPKTSIQRLRHEDVQVNGSLVYPAKFCLRNQTTDRCALALGLTPDLEQRVAQSGCSSSCQHSVTLPWGEGCVYFSDESAQEICARCAHAEAPAADTSSQGSRREWLCSHPGDKPGHSQRGLLNVVITHTHAHARAHMHTHKTYGYTQSLCF